MATPVKTQGTTLLAWQDIASAAISIGTALDVSTKFAGTVFARLGRATGSAFTSGWPNVRIEASALSSGNNEWIPLVVFQPAVGTSIAATTLNGAILAAATSCVVTSATNISVGDILFIGDSSAANYELVRVKSVSGTTVNFEEACTNAHSNGAVVTDQAEMWIATLDLSSVGRIRAVGDNLNSGQGIKVEVLVTTMDSVA